MSEYQAGYRTGRRTGDLGKAESVLISLLDVASKLGNHYSIQLIKHEIRKQMESLNREACNERSR